MGDLTENFSLSEFASRGTPVPLHLRGNVQRLANQLQVLRNEVGRIVITSAYRTLAHNADVGGATNSQHLTARAADFTVPGVSQGEVYCTVLLMIVADGMEEGGLGWYGEGGHIHYDVRGSRSRWNPGGPLPICTETPPPAKEEDMAVMIQAAGVDQVYVTNFVVKAKVISAEHRDQLKFSGVEGPNEVPQSFIDAIKDADEIRGTIS